MFKGVPITALDVMQFRDQIASNQQQWQQQYAPILISFTVNMMGVVKVNQASRRVFSQGVAAIENWFIGTPFNLVKTEKFEHQAGFHYLAAISHASAAEIKAGMIELEQQLSLGRLMDIDVIDINGRPVSRTTFGNSQRSCIVCQQAAKNCARSQAHSLESLQQAIIEMLNNE